MERASSRSTLPLKARWRPEAIGECFRAALPHGVACGTMRKAGSTARDLVAANAAAALVIAGVAIDLAAGTQLAFESIDCGRAAAKLEALVKATNS